MKKYFPIYFYGAIIILEGIFLLFSEFNTFRVSKLVLGGALTFASILAFIAAFSPRRKQFQIAYHQMHALTMLVYSLLILTFCYTFEDLQFFTSCLFVFYAFSEIIFSIWLFNLASKIDFKIIIIRLLLGLLIGIGAVAVMGYKEENLVSYGLLFIAVGVNIILYVALLKERQASLNVPEIAP
jgi:uncharacterized membrane protein HdeD (DUF308 family)